jgi:hypothetical protein
MGIPSNVVLGILTAILVLHFSWTQLSQFQTPLEAGHIVKCRPDSLHVAPKLQAHSNVCMRPAMWGDHTSGGWFVCEGNMMTLLLHTFVYDLHYHYRLPLLPIPILKSY